MKLHSMELKHQINSFLFSYWISWCVKIRNSKLKIHFNINKIIGYFKDSTNLIWFFYILDKYEFVSICHFYRIECQFNFFNHLFLFILTSFIFFLFIRLCWGKVRWTKFQYVFFLNCILYIDVQSKIWWIITDYWSVIDIKWTWTKTRQWWSTSYTINIKSRCVFSVMWNYFRQENHDSWHRNTLFWCLSIGMRVLFIYSLKLYIPILKAKGGLRVMKTLKFPF